MSHRSFFIVLGYTVANLTVFVFYLGEWSELESRADHGRLHHRHRRQYRGRGHSSGNSASQL
jgi:hypothetical protein